MQTKVFFINGNHFSNLNGFYDEVEQLLTRDLDWQAGHNLDAFNDLLYGGFGITEQFEKFTLVWKNSTKSRNDLGKEETIRYYEKKLASKQWIKFEMFAEKLEKMKRGEGETLFDVLVQIIQTHQHVTLVLEG